MGFNLIALLAIDVLLVIADLYSHPIFLSPLGEYDVQDHGRFQVGNVLTYLAKLAADLGVSSLVLVLHE